MTGNGGFNRNRNPKNIGQCLKTQRGKLRTVSIIISARKFYSNNLQPAKLKLMVCRTEERDRRRDASTGERTRPKGSDLG